MGLTAVSCKLQKVNIISFPPKGVEKWTQSTIPAWQLCSASGSTSQAAAQRPFHTIEAALAAASVANGEAESCQTAPPLKSPLCSIPISQADAGSTCSTSTSHGKAAQKPVDPKRLPAIERYIDPTRQIPTTHRHGEWRSPNAARSVSGL